jgi:protein-L-isoaspartate(D-aspartate) O-methyltransferase
MSTRRLNEMASRFSLLPVWLALGFAGAAAAQEPDYTLERAALTEEVRSQALYDPVPGHQGIDERVLEVLNRVPRHEFVPEPLRHEAYTNRPLPIGHGQTISQPYIVAVMTDLVQPKSTDVVLEVGTGSGYQAAFLAELVERVYSIEIIEPLAEQVKTRLERLGYDNITTRLGDGYYGWEEAAPFDAIVVTAAASHVPPPLIEQLKPGGRMVIPVGGRFSVQYLLLLEKMPSGEVITQQVMGVRFVPLTGEH